MGNGGDEGYVGGKTGAITARGYTTGTSSNTQPSTSSRINQLSPLPTTQTGPQGQPRSNN